MPNFHSTLISFAGLRLVSPMFLLKNRRGLQNTRLMVVCYLLVAVFVERQAWGTCGDYLGRSHDRMQKKSSSHSLLPVTHDPVKIPLCSGPECRRRDSIPNTPVEIPTSADSRDAMLLELNPITGVETAKTRPRGQVVRVIVFAVRVFRPPRVI